MPSHTRRKIINSAFLFRYIPETLKETNVISIPKSNDNPVFPQDRGQISLMDTMGKVMIKVVYK
jgi:hypothetical protein